MSTDPWGIEGYPGDASPGPEIQVDSDWGLEPTIDLPPPVDSASDWDPPTVTVPDQVPPAPPAPAAPPAFEPAAASVAPETPPIHATPAPAPAAPVTWEDLDAVMATATLPGTEPLAPVTPAMGAGKRSPVDALKGVLTRRPRQGRAPHLPSGDRGGLVAVAVTAGASAAGFSVGLLAVNIYLG